MGVKGIPGNFLPPSIELYLEKLLDWGKMYLCPNGLP
jgi:hypothetical protein